MRYRSAIRQTNRPISIYIRGTAEYPVVLSQGMRRGDRFLQVVAEVSLLRLSLYGFELDKCGGISSGFLYGVSALGD